MRLEHNLSFKEIAEETDVSINTALGANALCADQPAQDGGRPKPRADTEVSHEGNGRIEGCTHKVRLRRFREEPSIPIDEFILL